MMKFIDRDIELKALNDMWTERSSHFIIIYGKRRVGKTELIKQFIKDKPAIYFLSDKRSIDEQTFCISLGKRLGTAGRKLVEEKYSWDKIVETFLPYKSY